MIDIETRQNDMEIMVREDSSIDQMKDVDATTESKRTKVRGLRNLGNTCYMNAALQMLFSTESQGGENFLEELERIVCEYDENRDVMQLEYEEEKKEEESMEEKRLTVSRAVVDLWKKARYYDDEEVFGGADPTEMKEAVDRVLSQFVGYEQQDSHEFLTSILDVLHEEIIVTKTPPSSNAAVEETQSTPHCNAAVNETQLAPPCNDAVEDEEEEEKHVPVIEAGACFIIPDYFPKPKQPKRVTSYSQLDEEDIADLLHGESSLDSSDTISAHTQQPRASAPKALLVGGRAASCCSTPLICTTVPSFVPSTTPSSASSPQPLHQDKDTQPMTPISNNFHAHLQHTLQCDSCLYTRSHSELYNHLSLDIANKDDPITTNTIHHSLRRFFQPEKRQIKCEKCFQDTATQTTSIEKLPKFLILHLKRFLVHISPTYEITYEKNHAEVQFPVRLDISDYSEYSDASIQYQLKSTVHHIGSTTSCGHYTAHVQQRHDSAWVNCNDSFLNPISIQEVMDKSAQSTAYMLMYELC